MSSFTWPGSASYIAMNIPSGVSYANIAGYKTATASAILNLSGLTSGTAYTFSFNGSYFSQ